MENLAINSLGLVIVVSRVVKYELRINCMAAYIQTSGKQHRKKQTKTKQHKKHYASVQHISTSNRSTSENVRDWNEIFFIPWGVIFLQDKGVGESPFS